MENHDFKSRPLQNSGGKKLGSAISVIFRFKNKQKKSLNVYSMRK